MKILITGGAGFIGSNFIRYMLNKYEDVEIINFDKLTYAGNLANLRDLENNPRYRFVKADICNFDILYHLLKEVNYIIHFAAESHVDLSVGNSLVFTKSNTYGTHVLLEAARLCKNIKKILHVSTDEVYGDILKGSFKESDKLEPNNPYSASKAAAEMIVRSYYKTYKMPIVITRGNNVFGPFQYPEKIIPRFITDLMEGNKVPLHGDGSNIRTYVYIEDCCEAIDLVFRRGNVGEIYNIGTDDEISNLDLTKKLLEKMNKDGTCIDFVEDRPFNDKRYSVDLTKIRLLGWQQRHSFEDGLTKTIDWYQNNVFWWKPLKIAEKKLTFSLK